MSFPAGDSVEPSRPASQASPRKPFSPLATSGGRHVRWSRWLSLHWPGIAVCLVLTLAAYAGQGIEERLIGHAVFEALVLAILLGVALRNLVRLPAAIGLGVSFTAKQVLEFAIVLLGASVDVPQVLRAGLGLLVVIVVVACGLVASVTIGRVLGLNRSGHSKGRHSFSLTRSMPWFILGFLVLATMRSLAVLPVGVADTVRALSGWLTVAAMAALGLGVNIRAVRQAGARVSGAIILSLLVLLTLTLALVRVLGVAER